MLANIFLIFFAWMQALKNGFWKCQDPSEALKYFCDRAQGLLNPRTENIG